tara:strand:+ start:1226 stop:1510 length:285 start_codon:yes stop_codon:yes gene_type:complete
VGKGYKVLWGDLAFLWAQERLLGAELRVQEAEKALAKASGRQKLLPELPGGLLKRAISLTHPDKHNGSEAATRVTRELLALRERTTKKRKRRKP